MAEGGRERRGIGDGIVRVPKGEDDHSGVEPSVDWHEIVDAILDRLDGPTFVVDGRGTLRASNQAFAALVGCTTEELHGAAFEGLFRDDADALEVWEGETLELRSGPRFAVPQRLRARVRGIGKGAGSARVVQIEWTAPIESARDRLMTHRSYTVSAAPHTRGTLLEVTQSSDGQPAVMGGMCFRVMADRDEPCPRCPVFDELEPLPARSVVPPGEASSDYQIVEVARQPGSRLHVESLTIRDEVLAELMKAKVQWIAEESELTPREREVLELLYLGRGARDIANVLEISERTAKYHQANVLRKIGADSRVDLVRLLL